MTSIAFEQKMTDLANMMPGDGIWLTSIISLLAWYMPAGFYLVKGEPDEALSSFCRLTSALMAVACIVMLPQGVNAYLRELKVVRSVMAAMWEKMKYHKI